MRNQEQGPKRLIVCFGPKVLLNCLMLMGRMLLQLTRGQYCGEFPENSESTFSMEPILGGSAKVIGSFTKIALVKKTYWRVSRPPTDSDATNTFNFGTTISSTLSLIISAAERLIAL